MNDTSFKVDLFVDLIGKLRDIIKEAQRYDFDIRGWSSIPDHILTQWNELLCEIIILASFTNINQA